MRDYIYSEVLVVGAGIIGLSCAFALQRSGRQVTVLERSARLGAGSTGAAIGALWPPSPLNRGEFTAIIRESLLALPKFLADVEAISGIPTGYLPQPLIELILTPSQLAMAKREANACHPGEPKYELIGSKELVELGLPANELGAIVCRESAIVSPIKALESLEAACRKIGVVIRYNSPVADISSDSGLVDGVIVNEEKIRCRSVVITAGVESTFIAPKCKLTPVRGQMITVKAPGRILPGILRAKPYYLVQTSPYEIEIGSSTEKDSGFDPTLTPAVMSELLAGAKQLFPKIRDLPILSARSGLRPMSESRKPIVGEIPDLKGAFVASGHYKLGFSLAADTAFRICSLLQANQVEPRRINDHSNTSISA